MISGIYNSSYPRVDPSIISLVLTPDQSKCLLARSKRYIDSMYSCLAGFMEPGNQSEHPLLAPVPYNEKNFGLT